MLKNFNENFLKAIFFVMTESRSSVSSESLSTELVAKLFNALPDEKPDELSEFEYSAGY